MQCWSQKRPIMIAISFKKDLIWLNVEIRPRVTWQRFLDEFHQTNFRWLQSYLVRFLTNISIIFSPHNTLYYVTVIAIIFGPYHKNYCNHKWSTLYKKPSFEKLNQRPISHLVPSNPSLHSHWNSWAPFTSEQDAVFIPRFF